MQASPHGLTIHVDYSENIALPDGERVLRQLAQSGKYQIIVAHSSYADAVGVLRNEFPNIEWVLSGSGNKAYGGNVYWIDTWLHEADYLMGIIAGKMTKTNVIGTVAAFPYPNVNMYLNGFADGARSVNPNVKVQATYIGSWFDPPKAKEAAAAQIAAGADFIYAESFGVFQAVLDNPGTYAFGHYVDQNQLAPNIIVSSDLALWDPTINQLIDAWWTHVTKGTPYNASKTRIVALMKDGGVAIAPYHSLASMIPQSVIDAVNQAKADIISGKLVVPQDQQPLASG
jgi:basic membrane lipoprotein Med (substrate-binding protein (PBP1-ABC) superfamily)